MSASYNLWIVVLSYFVAVLASFLALEMATRVAAASGDPSAQTRTLPLAAIAMGTGIWSMHFVGMLALRLPIPLPYSLSATFLSLAFAIGASYAALRVVRSESLNIRRLATGGLLMGGGIALMHYTGMTALQIMPRPDYDPILWTLSVVIAVAAASAALWICFHLKSGNARLWTRVGSALVMGLAIWGMHFTGMAAVRFAPNSYCIGNPITIDNSWLAGTVAFVVLAMLMSLPMMTAMNTLLVRLHDGISIRRWSRIAYLVNGVLLAALVTLAVLVFLTEDIPIEAAERRRQAHALTDELASTANDLTRAARQYVQTGDERFERMHTQILAILDGESPRPLEYDRSFWLRAASETDFKPELGTGAEALTARLQNIGLTAKERMLLDQADRAMRSSISRELMALDAMKGRFHSANGGSTAGEPDPRLAQQLLFDTYYLRTKAEAMRPLAEFERSIDERNEQIGRDANRRIDFYISLMLTAIAALLASLGLTYLVTRHKVTSLLLLEDKSRRFGTPGFEFADMEGADEISHLGRTFAEMHRKVIERTSALELEISERKRAEDESERFFNQSLNLLMVAGFDGSYRRLNQAWEQALGFKHEYLLAHGFMDFVHVDDRASIAEAVRSVQRTGAAVAVECRCLCADGTYKSFSWNATRRDGESFYATGHDVSGLREIERSLSINEERFRRVVEAAPNGMVMADRDGRIVLVNAQAEQMFGYARDRMIGQAVEMLMPENLRAAHPAHRRDFNAKPEARAMGGNKELLARRADGSEFPVEIGISPISSREGMMVLSSIVDITERKRAERELRASEMQLNTIVENLAEGVIVSGMDGQLLHFNQAAVVMHGLSDANEGLMHLLEFPLLFELKTLDGVVCSLEDWPLSRALRGDAIKDAEFRVRRIDRENWDRVLSYSSSLVPDADGNPQMAVLTVSDLTERKRAEEEKQQAQKLESVGRLAAGVAHEINSPLQFINDCCNFVRDGVNDLGSLVDGYRQTMRALAEGRISMDTALKDTAQREQTADLDYLLENMPGAMDRSLDGLQRVTEIVRSMKEFAHPDQREKTPADLNQAIQSTLTIARHEYKYVADVITDLGTLPPVPCYVGDLNQAILNLIVNAAHAIEDVVRGSERKGHIRVCTRVQGDEAIISIEDDGAGIPENIRSKIFDPFFTTKGIGKGTGQGLAIVRSVVVDMHRGRLDLDTWPGKGTRFVIRLPLRSTPDVEAR